LRNRSADEIAEGNKRRTQWHVDFDGRWTRLARLPLPGVPAVRLVATKRGVAWHCTIRKGNEQTAFGYADTQGQAMERLDAAAYKIKGCRPAIEGDD
jgi:hypothetical protein